MIDSWFVLFIIREGFYIQNNASLILMNLLSDQNQALNHNEPSLSVLR